MNDFLEKLQSYLFYIVQVRIYKRLLKFAHGIKINGSSPFEVQFIINLPVNTVNPHSVPQWQGIFSDADYYFLKASFKNLNEDFFSE